MEVIFHIDLFLFGERMVTIVDIIMKFLEIKVKYQMIELIVNYGNKIAYIDGLLFSFRSNTVGIFERNGVV